jgi:hypothetical protein
MRSSMARNIIALILVFGPYFGVMLYIVFHILHRATLPYRRSRRKAAPVEATEPVGLTARNPLPSSLLS